MDRAHPRRTQFACQTDVVPSSICDVLLPPRCFQFQRRWTR